ncbi:hypothetical protein [Neobacillus mesonae]|nr:hypothetical protein [Neobacillus mesonae]
MKKSSPNKKYVCSIICHHEVNTIDVYIEIKKRNSVIVNKELLFSIEDTDEQNLFNNYGDLKWVLNHKVMFSDKDYKQVYS